PVQCQYLAMRGVRALFERVERLRAEHHPDLGFLGVVATMYRAESRIDREVVEELRRVLGRSRVKAVIEHDLKAAEAPIAGRALVSLHPESPAALAYIHLAEQLTEP
ncbi:MAG: ParA family protein, partial [Holophagales bacterium]|nr:ParA family protein [Holophagales bacterium]